MSCPTYLVQKARMSDDRLYGPTHRSHDAKETLCHKAIDERWWVVDNSGDPGLIPTCVKCRNLTGMRRVSAFTFFYELLYASEDAFPCDVSPNNWFGGAD